MINFFESCLRAAKEKVPKMKSLKKIKEEIMEIKYKMYLEYQDNNLSENDYRRLCKEFNDLVEE